MVLRDAYPPGVPCWVDIAWPDLQAAADFYGGVFDWDFDERAYSARPYLVAQLDGQDVAGVGSLARAGSRQAAWSTYIAVADADDAARRVRDAGGNVVEGPIDLPGAGRMAVCSDPSGAVFIVWQAVGLTGAQLVNAPGSWNFSDLSTPDPEGAEAFYAAVFGWTARTIDFGTMWCLPGYGEFLATLDPDLPRKHADEGVPAGFSDAVAWLSTPPGGDAIVDAAWGIAFAVDDTDLIVDRVTKLGGSVVVPPYDAGPARIAVVQDPLGATFSVSRYQPASS